MPDNQTTAEARYAELERRRHFYLSQAERSALLTIPSLFPENSDQQDRSTPNDLPQPWQSFGAYATESLASKFLLTSFPPTQSFFRFEISEKEIADAIASGTEQQEVENLRLEIQKALASRERAINKEFEAGTYRVQLQEVFRQLLVAGNCLVYMPPEGGGLQVFNLGQYVVSRDPLGKLTELIVRECFHWTTLPEEVQNLAQNNPQNDLSSSNDDEIVAVYTHLKLDGKHHITYQEAFSQKIPGSESKFKIDKSPWLPLRFSQITGEHYGRGFIENYRGTLNSLDVLRRSIVENSAAAARTVFMVRPNGTTKVRTLQSTPNGGYVSGSADDVSVLRMDKQGDMGVAQATADGLIRELSFAFLLNSAIRRDAERVTAEEIREMARELEGASGGAYSVLSQELQLPIVSRLQALLERRGDIPAIPGDSVKPVVVTGLQAIGRSQELITVRELLSDLAAAASLNPQIVQFIDAHDLASKILMGHGVPEDGLLKTKEEVQAEMEAQQAAQTRANLIDSGMQAIPGVVENAANQMMNEGGATDGSEIQ